MTRTTTIASHTVYTTATRTLTAQQRLAGSQRAAGSPSGVKVELGKIELVGDPATGQHSRASSPHSVIDLGQLEPEDLEDDDEENGSDEDTDHGQRLSRRAQQYCPRCPAGELAATRQWASDGSPCCPYRKKEVVTVHAETATVTVVRRVTASPAAAKREIGDLEVVFEKDSAPA